MVPSSALGLHLLDCEFRPCLQYWLGLPIFPEGGRCPVCHASFGRPIWGSSCWLWWQRGQNSPEKLHPRCNIFSSSNCCPCAKEGVAISNIYLAPKPALLTSSCPNGIGDVQLHLMLQSYQLAATHFSRCSHYTRSCLGCQEEQENDYACFTIPGCGSILCPTCHRVPWGLE